MRNLNDYAIMAANLPQDAGTDIYQFFAKKETVENHVVLLNDVTNGVVKVDASPVGVFRAMSRGKSRLFDSDGYFYISASKIGEDGKVLPKGVYRYSVMYHKRYSRRDVAVRDVTFNVVGLKRKSSKLPSGILISNIYFKI